MPPSASRIPRHPVTRFAARIPGHVLVSAVIVALSAGGFVAARAQPAEEATVTGAGDVSESALPTPIPLTSGTPLPTPLPEVDRAAIVDTAVTFWGTWMPFEVPDALAALADGSSGTARTSGRDDPPPAPALTPSPAPPPADAGSPAAPPPSAATPAPQPVPLPTLAPLPTLEPLPTVEPLPTPLPTLDPALPDATLPPLLP